MEKREADRLESQAKSPDNGQESGTCSLLLNYLSMVFVPGFKHLPLLGFHGFTSYLLFFAIAMATTPGIQLLSDFK